LPIRVRGGAAGRFCGTWALLQGGCWRQGAPTLYYVPWHFAGPVGKLRDPQKDFACPHAKIAPITALAHIIHVCRRGHHATTTPTSSLWPHPLPSLEPCFLACAPVFLQPMLANGHHLGCHPTTLATQVMAPSPVGRRLPAKFLRGQGLRCQPCLGSTARLCSIQYSGCVLA